MSRRISSGSRFQSLPIEGENSGSDSDSSAEEMTMSRDFYPTYVPGAPTSAQSLPKADDTRKMPSVPVSGPSGSQISKSSPATGSGQGYVKPRSIPSQPISSEDPSGLDFAWGHYTRQSNTFDDVGLDYFDKLFDQTTQETQEQQDLPTSIEQDLPILKDIGFNIEYPGGLIGEGFYGVVYRGYYGTNV